MAESLPQWLDSGKGLVSCVVSHVQTHRAGTESTERCSVHSVLTELQPLRVAGVQHLAVLTVILALKIPAVASLHAKLTVPSLVFTGDWLQAP